MYKSAMAGIHQRNVDKIVVLDDDSPIEISKRVTKVVNFFGGPGAGKSRTAARIFSEMKDLGINCELVPEYAKDLVWKQSFKVMGDEVYIFGKQQHKLYNLRGVVDYIVTDSPIILPVFYDDGRLKSFKTLIMEIFDSYENYNFLLNRRTEYNPVGRTQTKEEAMEKDIEIHDYLIKHNIPFTFIDNPKENAWDVVRSTLKI